MTASADRTLGAAAALVAAVMLFWRLGSAPLMLPDEGRNAEIAREMAASSSWLVPTLEGHAYLDKPAAYFAAVALSLRVFGVNEWGARLPSALCGLAILGMVHAFAARQYDRATAAFAVIVAATSPLVFAFSRIVIMDIALAACAIAAIFSSFVAEDRAIPDRRWHAAGALFAGLGTLVKGPVGALVPAAVLGVFFWKEGRWGALRRVFSPLNVAIVLALFVPWFAALAYVHPEFVRYGLVEETAKRFFTPSFNRGQPFWYFGPALLASLLPWSVLFVSCAFAAWPARARLSSVDRLLIVWIVVVVVFFSLSRTKQPGYILTAVVAAALLIGRALGGAWRDINGRAARLVARGSLALAAVALLLSGALGWAVLRGITEGGRREARAIWESWATFLVVLLVIAFLGVVAWARRSVAFTTAAFALFPLALVTVAYPAYAGFAQERSAKPLAEALAAVPESSAIVSFESYPAGLSFYLGRTITVVSETGKPLRSNFIMYQRQRQASTPPTLESLTGRAVEIVASDEEKENLAAWLGGETPVRLVRPGWWGASIPRFEGR